MKKILFLIGLVFVAGSVQASYLYWQLIQDDAHLVEKSGGVGYTFNGHDFAYAQVVVKDGGKTTILKSTWDDGTPQEGVQVTTPDPYVSYAVDVSVFANNNTATFYVELIGYDSAVYGSDLGVIGTTAETTYTYAALQNSGYIGTTLTVIPQAWTGGALAAPEPTSGLLVLLGLASLALKRKAV